MIDWVTVSALATADGTLVLAVATFASLRSANRAARAAERSLLAGLRPLLMPSRLQDPRDREDPQFQEAATAITSSRSWSTCSTATTRAASA